MILEILLMIIDWRDIDLRDKKITEKFFYDFYNEQLNIICILPSPLSLFQDYAHSMEWDPILFFRNAWIFEGRGAEVNGSE